MTGTVVPVAIPEEDVAQVRAATDIVALIGEHAALKRQGPAGSDSALPSGEVPSFSVNAEEGLYYCFGCQDSGDAISFVRDDRAPRLRRGGPAAGRQGRRHHHRRRRRHGRDGQRRNPLYEAMDQSRGLLSRAPPDRPDGGPARDYLRSPRLRRGHRAPSNWAGPPRDGMRWPPI